MTSAAAVRRGATAALLAGCTTLSPYQPDGPTAAVQLIGNAFGGEITFVALDAPGCGGPNDRLLARLYQEPYSYTHAVYLADGAPASAPAISQEVRVTAGRRMAVFAQVNGKLDGWYFYGCARSASFVPEAGARYEVVYWTPDPRSCRVDVWRVEAGRRVQPSDYAQHPSQCTLRAID